MGICNEYGFARDIWPIKIDPGRKLWGEVFQLSWSWFSFFLLFRLDKTHCTIGGGVWGGGRRWRRCLLQAASFLSGQEVIMLMLRYLDLDHFWRWCCSGPSSSWCLVTSVPSHNPSRQDSFSRIALNHIFINKLTKLQKMHITLKAEKVWGQ